MIPFKEISSRLQRISGVSYLLTAYIDESYNARTFCVGGWLADNKTWPKIEKPWDQRIKHEQKISIKKGFPPISRYHASDLSNFKSEFDRTKGWDEDRSKRFCKKLFQILADNEIAGIVMGGGIEAFKRHFPRDNKRFLKGMYYFSAILHFYEIADLMKEHFPKDRVTIYYDRTRDFGTEARRAFDSMMNDPRNKHVSKYFVTMAPLGWEDAIPLQPADMIAYEGMKRIDGSIRGNNALRKSLNALIGKRVPIKIGHFDDKFLANLVENKKRELGNEE